MVTGADRLPPGGGGMDDGTDILAADGGGIEVGEFGVEGAEASVFLIS
jgi:hypothetical protein